MHESSVVFVQLGQSGLPQPTAALRTSITLTRISRIIGSPIVPACLVSQVGILSQLGVEVRRAVAYACRARGTQLLGRFLRPDGSTAPTAFTTRQLS